MELSRNQLYERVWEKPLRDVAKELGLSDVGLAKLCRRREIPIPHQGYWLMAPERRARVVRPKLRPAPQGQSDAFDFDSPAPEHTAQSEEERFRQSARQEARALVAGSGPPTKRAAQEVARVVQLTRSNLNRRRTDERGIVVGEGTRPWMVRTSPQHVDAGLRVLHLLWLAIRNLGFAVDPSKEHPLRIELEIRGVRLVAWVEEHSTRRERELTAKELAEKAKNPAWFYFRDRYIFTPSGQLILKLAEYSDYPRRQWADSKRRPLEARIDEVIVDIFEYVAEVNRRRELSAMREREWEEARRRAEEERQRREIEARKRASLKAEAETWETARRVQRYLAAVRRAGFDPASRVFKNQAAWLAWLEWGERYCQSLDPITGNRAGQAAREAVAAES